MMPKESMESLPRLRLQELECHETVGGYVHPLGFLVDLEAGLIDMNGQACQKMLWGGESSERCAWNIQEKGRTPCIKRNSN